MRQPPVAREAKAYLGRGSSPAPAGTIRAAAGLSGSRHPHLRELRVQRRGEPVRIFYAFDPRRTAILLIGGRKTGDDRFYQRMIPLADRLYDVYLIEIKKEGLIP